MPAFIAKSQGAWEAQARAAYTSLADRAPAGATLADLAGIDREQFALLIEALVALEPATGVRVGADLVALAGLAPVDQVLGLPPGRVEPGED